VAREFQRFGLKPGGDNGTFIQHYGVIRRTLDTAATKLEVGGAHPATLRFGADFNATPFTSLPEHGVAGPLVVLAGPPDSANPFGGQSIAGAWVALWAPPGQGRGGMLTDIVALRAAAMGGAAGILLVSRRPDAEWQARLARSLRPVVALEGQQEPFQIGPILELRDAAAARALGIDSATFASAKRVGRRVESVTLSFQASYQVLSRVTAPNTVGILEGSDPQLKNEYIVYSAHMDHVGTAGPSQGCQARGADSICNGADDDGSGTVSVIETAEAFSQLQPRPKRSIIFLTVSGEEHGLWGSAYFTDHPPVPITSIVADLNTDMVGRNWPDTIVAIGKEHSDLGATLNRVGAAHPELNMKPIDDIWPEESFYTRSDHFNFARKGVPILFFFNGTHPDYHQVSDSPDKIDGEKEARIIKLVFYLGLEIANAAQKPKWNPESYRQIVQQATN
jgi:Zn-dependent M28 family amino/carboxypeptidase